LKKLKKFRSASLDLERSGLGFFDSLSLGGYCLDYVTCSYFLSQVYY